MPPPQRSPPDQPSHQQSPPHSDTLCLNPAFSPSYPLHTQEFFCLSVWGVGNRSLQVTSVSLAPNIESGTSRSFERVNNNNSGLYLKQPKEVNVIIKPTHFLMSKLRPTE